jgi:hypothetical protein
MVEMYGGYVQNSISRKLHYLVVCDKKTPVGLLPVTAGRLKKLFI